MPYQNLNNEQFKEKIKTDSSAIILDVRTSKEVAEGSIENHINIDYYQQGFINEIATLDKEITYLVYCRSGKRSSDTCSTMEKLGFKNLYNLENGYMNWS